MPSPAPGGTSPTSWGPDTFPSSHPRLATPREARKPVPSAHPPCTPAPVSLRRWCCPLPQPLDHPLTMPTQPRTHTHHAGLSWGWLEAGQRAAMGVPRLLGWEASQLLTSRNGPGCHGYSRARLWAKSSRGSLHRPPQYSQCSQAIPRGMVVGCVPQRAEAVSPAVCLSTKAQVGPTWPRVSEGGPKLGKGWPKRSSPAGGSRCSWGSARPYLPGRGEGSQRTAAASPMAARTWPETPASGSSLSSRRVPSRPLGIWGWVVLSLISPSAAAQCEIWLWREKGGEKRIM